MSQAPKAWAHPTAIVEEGVRLGMGTKVWDNAHVRRGASIGHSCIVGEKTYIAYDVTIGDFVKINAAVYVCAGVTIEDFVMIAAHVVFTNDRFPRAGDRALSGLETSDVTEETLMTRVCRGVTIGANATIGPGLTLGEFSMVGMGSVVTRDVPPHWVVAGNPARRVGYACVCGQPMIVPTSDESALRTRFEHTLPCERCGRRFIVDDAAVHLTHDPFAAG
jgi:acetyltransferase-like isoleucine patch superfamily enzyme